MNEFTRHNSNKFRPRASNDVAVTDDFKVDVDVVAGLTVVDFW